MKKFAICLVFILLSVGIVNAQKSVTGTVLEYNNDYKTITVNIGKSLKVSNKELDGTRSIVIFTKAFGSYECTPKTCKYSAPKIIGNVKGIGRRVRVYYTKIIEEHGFGYILVATKIAEIK